MCFTAEETALIDGIIVSYFAPQSVSEHIRLRYFKTHKHLQEETVGVGRSQPYFVGNNGPFFVGKLGANQ